jgi:hypothetical protein
MADQSVDVTERELREALAESFPERERREHERVARIMASDAMGEMYPDMIRGEVARRGMGGVA